MDWHNVGSMRISDGQKFTMQRLRSSESGKPFNHVRHYLYIAYEYPATYCMRVQLEIYCFNIAYMVCLNQVAKNGYHTFLGRLIKIHKGWYEAVS